MAAIHPINSYNATTSLPVRYTGSTATNSTTATIINAWPWDQVLEDQVYHYGMKYMDIDRDHRVVIPKGEREYKLPDNTVLCMDDKGNFRMVDKDAKVVYQANRLREFNPYLNASDLLAKFIGYLGTLGVRRREVKDLPLNLFVNWLILEAAEMDGDPIPEDVKPLPENRLLKGYVQPRCNHCQRFIKRILASKGFPFCGPPCAERLLAA